MNQAKEWTVTDVVERFEEAAFTLRRLPSMKVDGYFNTYPDVIRTTVKLMHADKLPLRLSPSSSAAISRMASGVLKEFQGSGFEEKREFLNYVFHNLQMNGKELEYTTTKPFVITAKCAKTVE